MPPVVVLNTVGLTCAHLAQAPRLSALARGGWSRPLQVSLPALTCSAQATLLTGVGPREHGIVGNGWLYRDTMEVRFWQQSNRLLQAEPLYATARRRARAQQQPFTAAKLFWWFNQGADVDVSVTPKPHYGADGAKAFDIQSYPDAWTPRLKARLGPFPFPTFWGPMAGAASSQWIGRCAAEILAQPEGPTTLTLVYLPHLDYDTQRLGPRGCDWPRLVRELDDACAPVLDAAAAAGAQVWVVNEYTHLQVDTPVYLNRVLRQAGWLAVREGPFGEQLEPYASRAFAVCDHQVAHVYLQNAADLPKVRELLASQPGVAEVLDRGQQRRLDLDHPRAGELVMLSRPNAWFAYPFWLDDRKAPDYARTVDIHRKPGYDPCELFFDPRLSMPKLRAMRRLVQKTLGFRTLFDLIPLDADLVKGSHGLEVDGADSPVLIGAGTPPGDGPVAQTQVKKLLLAALDLAEPA